MLLITSPIPRCCFICGSLNKLHGHISCNSCKIRIKQLNCECQACITQHLQPLFDLPVHTISSFGVGHRYKF